MMYFPSNLSIAGAVMLATVRRVTAAPTAGLDAQQTGNRTMGFIGCSMAENVAQGYVAVGGRRMWGPYGTNGMVVQSWTDSNSTSWQLFDKQVASYGKPTAVWVQLCIYAQDGVTFEEAKTLIANARQHAAPGATIYITGQPAYEPGQSCLRAGDNGPELTERIAKKAAADTTQNVTYPGEFKLLKAEVLDDGCHANSAGQKSLGQQALVFWG